MSDAPDGWLQPDWPAPRNVRSIVTTRWLEGASQGPLAACNLGIRNGDDPARVHANRLGLQRSLGLPGQPVWLRQVHGRGVCDADAASPDAAEPEADAARTRQPGRVLAILTADCLPVFFCAVNGSEVAIAHAGWRGLAGGVLEATLAALNCPAADVMAWIGPGIGADSYEVGEEVRAAFAQQSPDAAMLFRATRPGHWQCDLAGLARQRLEHAGTGWVGGGGFDTFVDDRFFSHRRDPACGRFASLIWIESGACGKL